jgi:hypothetical protein
MGAYAVALGRSLIVLLVDCGLRIRCTRSTESRYNFRENAVLLVTQSGARAHWIAQATSQGNLARMPTPEAPAMVVLSAGGGLDRDAGLVH